MGISIFSLGITFNYLVSLFYRRPIRQGLFGRPLFKTPLESHFWWLGGIAFLVGLVVGVVSLALSLNGWEIARLWLYLSGSALSMLVGLQLVVFWLLARILAELSQRDVTAARDQHKLVSVVSAERV
jgi:hypothetical protein